MNRLADNVVLVSNAWFDTSRVRVRVRVRVSGRMVFIDVGDMMGDINPAVCLFCGTSDAASPPG